MVWHKRASGNLVWSDVWNITLTLTPSISCTSPLQPRGVTGIFFWGGKVIFPDFFPRVKCFFPVESSHFGRPKTNFCRFQKWKAKKKKKKKKKKVLDSRLFLWLFLLPFPISTFPFPIFLLFFLIFTPFPFYPYLFFSRYVTKNFPARSLGWGHSARLLRHCCNLFLIILIYHGMGVSMMIPLSWMFFTQIALR